MPIVSKQTNEKMEVWKTAKEILNMKSGKYEEIIILGESDIHNEDNVKVKIGKENVRRMLKQRLIKELKEIDIEKYNEDIKDIVELYLLELEKGKNLKNEEKKLNQMKWE